MSDLARFRWHTGARLRRGDVDEKLPPLVRDVGPVALARFLRGSLHRLAGPRTPLLYLRTPGWREPYVDHAGTGRLLFLDPHGMDVWTSGTDGVYVAHADQRPRDPARLVYLPAGTAVPDDVAGADSGAAEIYGADFAKRARDDLAALDALNAACDAVEVVAGPLRRRLQSGDPSMREHMAAVDVDERDLTAAFHHLETPRRVTLLQRLQELGRRLETPNITRKSQAQT